VNLSPQPVFKLLDINRLSENPGIDKEDKNYKPDDQTPGNALLSHRFLLEKSAFLVLNEFGVYTKANQSFDRDN